MKALVWTENKALEYKEVEEPQIQKNNEEVRKGDVNT